MTEHIEEGYENKFITGLALFDLSSAYDIVNHHKLLFKIYEILGEFCLIKIVESLLQNRQFFVMLEGKKSHWRNQKNGLAQGKHSNFCICRRSGNNSARKELSIN